MSLQKHDRIWTLVHRLANAVTSEDLLRQNQTLIVRLGHDELTVAYEPAMPIGVQVTERKLRFARKQLYQRTRNPR